MQEGKPFYQAANGEKWLNSTVRTNAALNVGGRAVQVPAAMRMAANAPRVLAAAVVPSFPLGLAVAGLSVAAMLAEPAFREWMGEAARFSGNGIGPGGEWQMRESGGIIYQGSYGNCSGYSAEGVMRCALAAQHGVGEGTLTGCRVDSQTATSFNGSCVYTPNGVRLDSGGSKRELDPVWVPKTEAEMHDYFAGRELPSELSNRLRMPFPVQNPIINPSPGLNPAPQPLSIPTGSPVPVPNTDPQQWTHPSVRVVPSPTTASPWRVDVTDDTKVTTDPTPMEDPTPTEGSDPAKDTEQSDICKANPDILACSKPELDTPDGEIPRSEKTVNYQAENVFGEGSCPADVVVPQAGGKSLTFSYEPICGPIQTYVRPAIIALALFGAYLIILPGGWKQS
jgi:hypothetical protein